MKSQKGITLIALVVTIVVLLILAGVSINAIFSQEGLIAKAQNSQNKMNEAQQSDLSAINALNNFIENGESQKSSKVQLTIRYLDESEAELKETITNTVNKNATISINVPDIEGYLSKTVKIISTGGEKSYNTDGTLKKLDLSIEKDLEIDIIYKIGETIANEPVDFPKTKTVTKIPIGMKTTKITSPTYNQEPDVEYKADIEPLETTSGNITITFDMTGKANVGDTVKVYHYDTETSQWTDIATKTVPEGCLIQIEVTSFSPFICAVYHASTNNTEQENQMADLAETTWQMNEVLTDYSWLQYFNYEEQTGSEEMPENTSFIFKNSGVLIYEMPISGITKVYTGILDLFSSVGSSSLDQIIWVPKNNTGISSGWYIIDSDFAVEFLDGQISIEDAIQQFDFDKQNAPTITFGEEMFTNTTFINWLYQNATIIN